jgi:hypothetical protein
MSQIPNTAFLTYILDKLIRRRTQQHVKKAEVFCSIPDPGSRKAKIAHSQKENKRRNFTFEEVSWSSGILVKGSKRKI